MSDFILQVEKLSASAREKALIDHIEQLQAYQSVSVALQREVSALKQTIEQLQATIKEWESGALVRGWREIRADAQPPDEWEPPEEMGRDSGVPYVTNGVPEPPEDET